MPEDLFGSTDLDPPKKGGPDYLTWLNNLDLPDGLKFLQLSTERPAPGVPAHRVEVIIAVHPDDPKQRWHQLVIDLRTGQKYVPGAQKARGYSPVYQPVTSAEILQEQTFEEGPQL